MKNKKHIGKTLLISLIFILICFYSNAQGSYPKLILFKGDSLMAFSLNQSKKLIEINEENKLNKQLIIKLEEKINLHNTKDSLQEIEIIELKRITAIQAHEIKIESQSKNMLKVALNTKEQENTELVKKFNKQVLKTKIVSVLGIGATAVITTLYLLK
jgi:hypothetical protein